MTHDVRNNAERSRYELWLDGHLVALADYHLTKDAVVFPHTEVEARLRGRGLGAVLVQGALDDVRPTGRRVVPHCWYVAQFIDEHPEYQDLLAA